MSFTVAAITGSAYQKLDDSLRVSSACVADACHSLKPTAEENQSSSLDAKVLARISHLLQTRSPRTLS